MAVMLHYDRGDVLLSAMDAVHQQGMLEILLVEMAPTSSRHSGRLEIIK